MEDCKEPIIFSAGPAALPGSVLAEASLAVKRLGPGLPSILSISHRSFEFASIIAESNALIKRLIGIPDGYQVIWMQGGATLQFAAVIMNILVSSAASSLVLENGTPNAIYCVSGAWSCKAAEEAKKLGIKVKVVSPNDLLDTEYDSLTELSKLVTTTDPPPLFSYICTNETIHGIELPSNICSKRASGALFHVADMSSDLLARPISDIENYDIIFAGVQKNLGPAGVTCIIVKDTVLLRDKKPNKNLDEQVKEQSAELRIKKWCPIPVPTMMDYEICSKSDSCYNTPPVFAIYVVLLQLRWLSNFQYKSLTGISAVYENNREKASHLYSTIDLSKHFRAVVKYREHRSITNIVFHIYSCSNSENPSIDLENSFIKLAASKHNIIGLEGHRSIGGLRASLYNSVTLRDVNVLVSLILEFDKEVADKSLNVTI